MPLHTHTSTDSRELCVTCFNEVTFQPERAGAERVPCLPSPAALPRRGLWASHPLCVRSIAGQCGFVFSVFVSGTVVCISGSTLRPACIDCIGLDRLKRLVFLRMGHVTFMSRPLTEGYTGAVGPYRVDTAALSVRLCPACVTVFEGSGSQTVPGSTARHHLGTC